MTDKIVPETISASYDESLAMAFALNAQVKECYYNSIVGCATLTKGIPYDRIQYVEGVAIDRFGLPLEHGWMKVDGKIIDPTWVIIYDREKMSKVVYVPAIRYTVEEIKALFTYSRDHKVGIRLPIFKYSPTTGKEMHHNPRMNEALRVAFEHSFGSNTEEKIIELFNRGIVEPIS